MFMLVLEIEQSKEIVKWTWAHVCYCHEIDFVWNHDYWQYTYTMLQNVTCYSKACDLRPPYGSPKCNRWPWMGGGNHCKCPLTILLKWSHIAGWSFIAEVLRRILILRWHPKVCTFRWVKNICLHIYRWHQWKICSQDRYHTINKLHYKHLLSVIYLHNYSIFHCRLVQI